MMNVIGNRVRLLAKPSGERGLAATRRLAEGQVLFSERPIASIHRSFDTIRAQVL